MWMMMLAAWLSQSALAGDAPVTWGDGWIKAGDRELFRDESESGDGYSSQTTYRIRSVVGHIVSVEVGFYADGGAHPTYGTSYRAVDAKTGKTLQLNKVVDEEALLAALVADGVVARRLGGAKPDSLDALFANLDGGCEMDLSARILESFAFHHVKGDKVAVRIGVSHGCEVMRGNFTQLGLYLPIPASLKEAVATADAKGTLMEDLAKK